MRVILTAVIVGMSLWDAGGHLATLLLGQNYLATNQPDWIYWLHGISTFRAPVPAETFWVTFHCIVAAAALSLFLISRKS